MKTITRIKTKSSYLNEKILFISTGVFLFFVLGFIWYRPSEGVTEICINEVCVNNYSCYQNVIVENGTSYSLYDDYIELYNLTDENVFLDKYCITNNKEQFRYLSDLVIPAKGHLLLSVKKKQEFKDEVIVPFEFEADSDNQIYLIDERGTVLEEITVPKIPYNTVYCRKMDGDAEWHCAAPSPMEENASAQEVFVESLTKPIFSIESGFYGADNEVALSLAEYQDESGEEISIYYTLDCSVPTKENGIKYTEAISLGNASTRKSIYANREDINAHSAYNKIQRGESLKDCETNENSALNEDTCVVISARAISDGGEMGPVVTHSYFVEEFLQRDYDGVAVISLTTDSDNLFDYQKGIYVVGELFETGIQNNPTPPRIDMAPANYWGTGKAWERPV